MDRCLTLAERGLGKVKSNPMVGSVVVHNGKIISEGYHEYYGGSHGERNAIMNCDQTELLQDSILYISMEHSILRYTKCGHRTIGSQPTYAGQ